MSWHLSFICVLLSIKSTTWHFNLFKTFYNPVFFFSSNNKKFLIIKIAKCKLEFRNSLKNNKLKATQYRWSHVPHKGVRIFLLHQIFTVTFLNAFKNREWRAFFPSLLAQIHSPHFAPAQNYDRFNNKRTKAVQIISNQEIFTRIETTTKNPSLSSTKNVTTWRFIYLYVIDIDRKYFKIQSMKLAFINAEIETLAVLYSNSFIFKKNLK